MCLLSVLSILTIVSCSEKKQRKEIQRDSDGIVLKNGQFYDSQESETNMVWICTGRSSHAYHSSEECYGIQACQGDIEMVSLDDAVSMGRTPCHYCHEENEFENEESYDPDKYDSYEQYLEEEGGTDYDEE